MTAKCQVKSLLGEAGKINNKTGLYVVCIHTAVGGPQLGECLEQASPTSTLRCQVPGCYRSADTDRDVSLIGCCRSADTDRDVSLIGCCR